MIIGLFDMIDTNCVAMALKLWQLYDFFFNSQDFYVKDERFNL